MAENILIPGEDVIIQDIIKKKDKIQKARSSYERNWLTNIAFLFGKQHFITSSKNVTSGLEERIVWELKSEERKNKVKRTSNYILPLYRSLLSRLLLMKQHISVEPTTNSDDDKSAARVAEEVLEDFWQMANKANPVLSQKYAGMPIIMGKTFGFALGTGRGYLYPYFNDKTVAKCFLDGEIVKGAIGEVECHLLNQFDVFEDQLGQFKIIQRVMSAEAVQQQYGVEVKAEDLGLSDIEQQLVSMMEGKSDDTSKLENAVRVFEYYEIPGPKYPQGRYIITTKSKLILDGVIPPEYKSKIPLFNIDYLDLMMSSMPQGMVDQLISLQEEYNYTLTKIYAYKKWLAGKLKVPKDAKLEVKYDDEIGQIIYYVQGQEPHWEVPPSPPTYLWTELDRIRRDMEDIAAVHDATKFDQAQVRSGVAIEQLNDLDNGQLSPILMGIEQALNFFAETVLDIIAAKYQEPRILNITGQETAEDVKVFKGTDTVGNRRIKISIGSNMPMNKTDRQQFIMGLSERGYIDKAKALDLMEFSDLSGLYNSVDEQAQKMEISEILKGVMIDPNEWDYHQAHIKVLEKYLKGDKFRQNNPQQKQALLMHRGLHQKFLLQEMQSASNQAPGQPQGQPIAQPQQ